MKWATLASQFIITQRESYTDCVLGNPMIKSIATSSYFHSDICKVSSNPTGGSCSVLTLWQVSQKGNILGNISLHSIPPIGFLVIMVHLIPPWMNVISGLMSLSKYLIIQFLDVRHMNPSFIPQNSLEIFSVNPVMILCFISWTFSSSTWPFHIS
jgi:hypothetical protein